MSSKLEKLQIEFINESGFLIYNNQSTKTVTYQLN
jgi:hypothetical protein